MAKRTEEKPFRPLESSLVHAVIHGAAPNSDPSLDPVEPSVLRMPQSPGGVGEGTAATPLVRHKQPAMAQRPRIAPTHASEVLAERMNREKRVLLTASEERAIERVIANLGAELGTSLKLSHVLRSCIRLVINAEHELIDRARSTGRTIRPPNGDQAAIEAFESVIASVLHAGLRTSRPVR